MCRLINLIVKGTAVGTLVAGAACLAYLGMDYVEKSERLKSLEDDINDLKAENKLQTIVHRNGLQIDTLQQEQIDNLKARVEIIEKKGGDGEKHFGRYPWGKEESKDEKAQESGT